MKSLGAQASAQITYKANV